MYKLTLADNTVIPNLELNGNNFVSQTALTAADFAGKLDSVLIEGPEDAAIQTGQHGPMILAEGRVQHWPDGYYFVLLDVPEEEQQAQAREAEITALQMAIIELYERSGN